MDGREDIVQYVVLRVCGEKREREDARVAQWWSIALPRRGSRVRIPSRAFLQYCGSPVLRDFRYFLCLSACRQVIYKALDIRS